MIIVLPFCNKDAQIACKNLEWMRELDGTLDYRCMLAYPEGTEQKWVDRMTATANKLFTHVHAFTYPESTEVYWPAGANWAWQNVARYIPMITEIKKGKPGPFKRIYPENEPWLWLEADAVPLKPKWLDALRDEYLRGGKPFMGHIVKEMGHMNGVAIYPNNVAMYDSTALMVQHSAWDVELREKTIELTHSANHLIQHCWVLINGKPNHNGEGIVATFRDTGEMHRILEKDAVLFHRCKDGSLIDCLMQSKSNNQPVQIGEVIIQVGNSEKLSKVRDMMIDMLDGSSYPKTEIFIVTYHKDAEFLKYSLYSIKKFCHGFTGVTVVCPERDVEIIEPICRDWGPPNTSLEMFDEPEGKGMLAHMAIECMAESLVRGCDYVLHFDSDCIFVEHVTPADYFVDGKPVLLMEAYERFRDKHPGVMRWQKCTSEALGWNVEYEFMRRHPAVHPLAIYPMTRQAVTDAQKTDFWKWAISGRNEFPQSWSEYNLLGAVAWEKARDKYHWINCAETVPPRDKLVQFWSHGGLDRPTDSGAFVPETPRTIIKRILGV